jgi:hypothetical protein
MMRPTSRSCLHRRMTSAGRARHGSLPRGDVARLLPEREEGGSDAAPTKMSSELDATRLIGHRLWPRMPLRGRRSWSDRASSEGRRRRGYRLRTETTKTIRHRRLRPSPMKMKMLDQSRTRRRDLVAFAWRASALASSGVVWPGCGVTGTSPALTYLADFG